MGDIGEPVRTEPWQVPDPATEPITEPAPAPAKPVPEREPAPA